MILDTPKLKDAVKQAKHYLAIGEREVYLDRGDDFPWQYVYEFESGGTHRLGIPVSGYFRAKHPCGLTFRWSFDLEAPSANGSSTFHIDVIRCHAVLKLLPVTARQQFSAWLKSTAKAVRDKGEEYKAVADDQFRVANELDETALLTQ